jgi:hypothetical protein
MEKCKQFALSGYGHVQDINLTGAVATLRIEVISLSRDAREILKDQIMIECRALPRLKKRLEYLDRQHPTKEGVTAWFQVVFHRIEFCQPKKLAEKGSPYLLKLTGELQAIENWLRDGMCSC